MILLSIEGHVNGKHVQYSTIGIVACYWREIVHIATAIKAQGKWSNGVTEDLVGQIRIFAKTKNELKNIRGVPVKEFVSNGSNMDKGWHYIIP